MGKLGVRKVLDTIQSYIIIGWMLALVTNTDTVVGSCTGRVITAMGGLNDFTRKSVATDKISQLVPIIKDTNHEGKVQSFCALYPTVRDNLNTMKADDCSGSTQIDMILAKFGGFDYMCNEGHVEYGKHYNCIDEMSETLKTTCPMEHQSLTNIHEDSFIKDETASSLCTMMDKYLLCSDDFIASKCGGKDAGKWYRNFIQGVFEKLVKKTDKLNCSFGDSILPMWAVGIIVVVALLIVWCVGRWLYVDGHCHRCCHCIFGKHCSSRRDSEKSGDNEKIESLTYRRGSLVDTIGDMHVPMTALHLDEGDSASLSGQPPQDYTRTPMKNGLMH